MNFIIEDYTKFNLKITVNNLYFVHLFTIKRTIEKVFSHIAHNFLFRKFFWDGLQRALLF